MKPFMFRIRSVPTTENKNFDTVGGAYVHVWVMDHALESVQDRALTYIKDRSWTPQEVLNAFEIQQEQISALGKDEENLYLMAQVYGIAADFLGWKNEPGTPEDPPQISEA